MQRTACMAVTVKADGVSEAVYNGQRDRVVEAVKNEMARQRAEMQRALNMERDRADMKEGHLSRVLASNLKRVTARKPVGPVKRALRMVENAWAMTYALIHSIPEIGERLGLWVDIEDDEEVKYECY